MITPIIADTETIAPLPTEPVVLVPRIKWSKILAATRRVNRIDSIIDAWPNDCPCRVCNSDAPNRE